MLTIRERNEPAPVAVELPEGASATVRPLGWREHSRCVQDSMDAAGRRDLAQYEYLVAKAALVGIDGVGRAADGQEPRPCVLPADADFVLEALFERHRDAVGRILAAALSRVVRAEEEKKG